MTSANGKIFTPFFFLFLLLTTFLIFLVGYWLGQKTQNLSPIKQEETTDFRLDSPTPSFIEEEISSTPSPTRYLLPKITPPLNWQVYTDQEKKFSVHYPQNYKLGTSESDTSVSFLSCNNNEQICLSGFWITVFNDYDGGSRREWHNKIFPNTLYKPYYEDYPVSGVNALIIMDGNTGGSTGSSLLIPKGNKMYFIAFPGGWNPDTGDKSNIEFIKQVGAGFELL